MKNFAIITKKMKNKPINIPSSAAGKGLKEELRKEASKRGMKIGPFASAILTYAVNNKSEFRKPLKISRPKDGAHIGATVSESTKNKLNNWKEKNKTSLGLLCCYILEKALEDRLLNDVFFNEEEKDEKKI